jgi:hypothetical protein
VLTQEFATKYQHTRTIYLDRNRVYSAGVLQLDRLATPPIEKYHASNMEEEEEEYNILALWKKRCVHARTNPERFDPSIGCQQHVGRKTEGTVKTEENGESSGESVSEKLAVGPITWYFYVSHARMEHRLHHSTLWQLRLRNV